MGCGRGPVGNLRVLAGGRAQEQQARQCRHSRHVARLHAESTLDGKRPEHISLNILMTEFIVRVYKMSKE